MIATPRDDLPRRRATLPIAGAVRALRHRPHTVHAIYSHPHHRSASSMTMALSGNRARTLPRCEGAHETTTMSSLRESIEQLPRHEMLDSLREAVSLNVDELGFDAWLYLVLPSGSTDVPFVAGSLPGAWYVRHIRAGLDDSDPVLSHCRAHALPLVWNLDSHEDDIDRCPSVLRDATGFDLRHGVSVPVHQLGCQWGVTAVASSRARSEPIDAATIGLVQFLAAGLHEAAHGFATATADGQRINLTEREQQCLHWAAEGKTGWEISRMLGIAERTVVFHLENAARKLGVFGRRQAVARAIALQVLPH